MGMVAFSRRTTAETLGKSERKLCSHWAATFLGEEGLLPSSPACSALLARSLGTAGDLTAGLSVQSVNTVHAHRLSGNLPPDGVHGRKFTGGLSHKDR